MKNSKLKEGMKAPDFSLPDAKGDVYSLSDFKGKNVVLYFYPRDNTPGCTIEALDFTSLKPKFAKKNTVILGVSKDSCESHAKFIDKKDLSIILLSDENSAMQKKYGVWRKKKFMGREFDGTVRTTVLIDEKGKILKFWDEVKVKGHAEEVLASLS